MPRTAPDPNSGYPPRWDVFDHFVRTAGCGMFGFSGTSRDLNRFAARYRASSSFNYIDFENLAASTSRGYSELCNLLLAYSAFEYYLKALGLTLGNCDSLLTVAERARTLAQIRALNGNSAYFEFIHPYCSKGLKYQIDLYLTPRVCNPFCLAAAARHVFAHGALTPNPTGVEPGTVETVTRLLRKIIMRSMERDFEQRMRDFEEMLEAP
jgi:hypothetical protein